MNVILQKKFIILLFLFISFDFIKSESDWEEIDYENNKYPTTLDSPKGITKFKVKGITNSPYFKIEVEGTGKTKETNHIISYFQNEKLTERKQLAQSLDDKTIMWLTEEQIKNDFYLTIECATGACEYKLNLTGENEVNLNVGEQYTYYVTTENKEMKFKFTGPDKDESLYENNFVYLWAKSNKNMETIFSFNDEKNTSSFVFYTVKYNNIINSNYNLNIKGEVGDLINVGLFSFVKNGNKIISELVLKNGEEVSSSLNMEESLSFNIPSGNKSLGYFYDFNNKLFGANINQSKQPNSNTYDLYSIIANENNLLFSLQYISDTKYDGQGNNKYSPQLNGIYYTRIIEEGATIGLIPMNPGDDFDFLTYEVIPNDGDIDVTIYKCENYPLCHINEEAVKNSKKVIDDQSYYYTYAKDEWGKEISSISKQQNMLLISCKNGFSSKFFGKNVCIANVNMKTNTKYITNTNFNKYYPSYCRFIRKNNEDKFFIEGKKNQINLVIEIYSGELEIKISNNNDLKEYKFKNKLLYIIPSNKDINITIKGTENSIYSIYDNYNKEFLPLGFNYLFHLENNEININPIQNLDYLDILQHNNGNDNKIYYSLFIDSNCDLDIHRFEDNRIDNFNITANSLFTSHTRASNYKISKLNPEEISSDNCLFYFLTSKNKIFKLGKKFNFFFILWETEFTERNKEILYYPHTELEKDIKLEFNLGTDAKFTIKILVDNKNLKSKTIKKSTKKLILKAKDIKNKCQDNDFLCKIIIEFENNNSDKSVFCTFILNTINPGEESDDDNDDDDDKKLAIIFSALGIIIIALIAGGIFYYLKVYKKNKAITNSVNQISFKDDDVNHENEGIVDNLLD